MSLSFKERKKILEKSNTLELIPVKLYENEIDTSGLVTVLIPKFKNKFAVNFISPILKSKFFRIKFDIFGSAVWNLIDGNTKVETIIQEMKNKFGEKLPDAENRIIKFVFQLYSQSFITFKELIKGE